MARNRIRLAPFLLLILFAPAFHAADKPSETEIRAILVDRIDRAEQSVGIVVGWIDAADLLPW